MENTVSKKTLQLLTGVVFIPFVVISIFSYSYIKVATKNEFINTMRRFNDYTAYTSIERPMEEISHQLLSISIYVTKNSIAQYLKKKPTTLDIIIPSVVNSTFFFKGSLITDINDNYRTYPFLKHEKFKPSERPWYYTSGIKDEIYYSEPYETQTYPFGKEITVSMNLYDNGADILGILALDIDLKAMSNVLKNIDTPFDGRFKVVAFDGSVVLYENVNEIFKRVVPSEWIKKSIENEGYFFDDKNKKYVFYKTYNNPNWIAYSIVDEKNFEEATDISFRSFYFTFFGCCVFYLMIVLLLKFYFKQLVTKLYMGVKGISIEDYKGLNNLYKQIKDNNIKLHDAIHDAETDNLTGISNRKKFNTDLTGLIARKKPFSLSIIDIDNFKLINDTYGHDFGDLVLKYVCDVGAKVTGNSENSRIYRIGGEELALLIDDNSDVDAYQTIDTWRTIVSLKTWAEKGLTVSFSAGIAAWRENDKSENILKRADVNMYNAKNTGKNKIVMDS